MDYFYHAFFFYLTGPLFVAVVLKKRSVNILQNISFCAQWKNLNHTGLKWHWKNRLA